MTIGGLAENFDGMKLKNFKLHSLKAWLTSGKILTVMQITGVYRTYTNIGEYFVTQYRVFALLKMLIFLLLLNVFSSLHKCVVNSLSFLVSVLLRRNVSLCFGPLLVHLCVPYVFQYSCTKL